jgi:hypothetical protein
MPIDLSLETRRVPNDSTNDGCSWRACNGSWERSKSFFISGSQSPGECKRSTIWLKKVRLVYDLTGTGKNLGVHAASASTCDDSEGDHMVYSPSSQLSSAQRAWSNICAPRRVQRICCFFSIRQSTSWSTVDSTRAVDMRWPPRYSLP